MKKDEKAVTLVALVVTIIILIILAGISINTLIGENGIITKAKQAKQNITLAGKAEAQQLNQLYYELEIGGELAQDEENNKKDEIIALLQKQISEKEAKIQGLQNQLNNLNSLLSQTNSTADKILSGYKAYSGGKLLTGIMINRGAISNSLNCGESYTIPAGYHNGEGKVMANSLASQTVGTAIANNLSNGATAWVNGNKVTGNGADINNSYNNGYQDGKTEAVSNISENLVYHKYVSGGQSFSVNGKILIVVTNGIFTSGINFSASNSATIQRLSTDNIYYAGAFQSYITPYIQSYLVDTKGLDSTVSISTNYTAGDAGGVGVVAFRLET